MGTYRQRSNRGDPSLPDEPVSCGRYPHLADDIPINLITVLICAIGGVVGWLIILVFHLLEIAF